MEFDIQEIREYYDSELRDYDYNELVSLGISHDNADFMTSIGVPEEFDDFVFYETNKFQKLFIEGVQFIKIGYFASYGAKESYGLYIKVGSEEIFTTSTIHQPQLYMINKNLRTFFLFHFIRHEVSNRMRQRGEYTQYRYAMELKRLYGQVDPEAMQDVESYWSHLIEDYETGL